MARIGLVVAGVLVFFAGLAGLTHWSQVSIRAVTVEGTYIVSPDEVKTKAFEIISENYLYIFSRKNAVLYPRTQLIDELKKTFPRIKDLQVNISDYHTLNIQITERQPKALWCNNPPIQNASSTNASVVSDCYFLDATGFVYSESPDFSGDAYFKYYGLVPFESPIGSSYLSSSDTFTQLSSFVTEVKTLNITPLYIVATSQDDFTMYIYGGGKIIFDDKESLVTTAEHLRLLLQTANLVPLQNGELQVEYIDLRYGNKLYYKVRQ